MKLSRKKAIELCCQIDCEKLAEWEIYADSVPDTVACTDHVGELLTDAKEHRIFRLLNPKCKTCNDTDEVLVGTRDHLSGGIEGDNAPCPDCKPKEQLTQRRRNE